MHFFGTLFWLVMIWFVFKAFRNWQSCGSRSLGRERDPDLKDRTAEQQDYIDALESRVAELEERLDFTERLIAGGREV
jgi:uncharacterized protein YlxW (UPF0749 family)